MQSSVVMRLLFKKTKYVFKRGFTVHFVKSIVGVDIYACVLNACKEKLSLKFAVHFYHRASFHVPSFFMHTAQFSKPRFQISHTI